MSPRILQIHLRRWLFDKKSPSVETTCNLPKQKQKITTNSKKKHHDKEINKNKNSNNRSKD